MHVDKSGIEFILNITTYICIYLTSSFKTADTMATNQSTLQTILAYSGELQANTPTLLFDPSTSDPVSLPESAVIQSVKVTLEGSNGVTANATLSVGYSGNIGAIINGTITTGVLNSNKCVVQFSSGLQTGLTSAQTLYIQSDIGVTGDFIVFEISYFVDNSALQSFIADQNQQVLSRSVARNKLADDDERARRR